MTEKHPVKTKKVIAAFDFDGTITTRDTLPAFIRFAVSFGHLIAGSLSMVPFLVLFKLKVIPNYKAKERLFKTFFAGITLDRFNMLSEKFIPTIEKLVNPAALEKLKWHQEMGHEVIIISASAENWIRPWAIKNGINTVLATKLQVIDHMTITGNFLTKNCHGTEKVTRLLEQYPERQNYILYAYGDSNGDRELLALADHPFYRSF
jgi:phosphatidylglycerophosphatase C